MRRGFMPIWVEAEVRLMADVMYGRLWYYITAEYGSSLGVQATV